MSVYPHAAGFIGLPTMFRLIKRIPKSEVTPGQSPDDGPIDVQLATSTDGRTWQRTVPRVAIIPRGAPGTFDGGAILGVSSTCVHVGDKTWVYYTGLTTTHGGPMPPKRLSIGRGLSGAGTGSSRSMPQAKAAWKRSRYDSAAHPSSSTPTPATGTCAWQVLESDGRAIPGLSLDDSEPLRH